MTHFRDRPAGAATGIDPLDNFYIEEFCILLEKKWKCVTKKRESELLGSARERKMEKIGKLARKHMSSLRPMTSKAFKH